jgi:uncharacterized membrane protein
MVKGLLMLMLTLGFTAPVTLSGGAPEFIALLVALFIHTFLTLILSPFMPKKTDKGRLAYEHILGFKLYLETAERDRVKFQEKEHLFYEFLPYAMTFKIADKWSKAFAGIYKNPPDWYMGAGTGIFDPVEFSHHLSDLSSQMSRTLASTPQSSGSGGSGFSGGYSGGGFGGGGGGSW